ncbi:MAG TPA: 2-iminoacetate synthase ThiH [Opitutaceae bacterium]
MSFEKELARHDFGAVARRIAQKRPADVSRALGRPRGGVDLEDFAALLSPAASGRLEDLAQASHALTVERFGRTMRLFAPLYLSNACANVCTYCGFSAHNRIRRKVLSDAEILADAAVLRAHGFDSVLLVTGETSRVGRGYLANALRVLRPHFSGLWIEVQPLPEEDYAALAAEGLSSVLVYQETYDPAAYARHHLSGPKSDMAWRLGTPDRLGRAGIKKIGLGALFGLSDWRADAWFTGLHLRHVETVHWRTRTAVSFPRLRPHEGAEIPVTPFGERDLVQAACAFRLLSPEAELSLSTRESEAFRSRAFRLGFTSMSAGSRTNPGGYASEPDSLEQFAIDDARSPEQVAAFLRSQGYEPVWKDWDSTYDGFTGKRSLAAVPA